MKKEVYRCHLCGKSYYEPIESHIIPKFFWNEIKKSGALIRSTENPNIRKQDGIKLAFFCEQCETLFNRFETKFKNKQYDRIINHYTDEILVDDDLRMFTYQLAFRTLSYSLYLSSVNPVPVGGGLSSFEEKYLIDLEKKMKTVILLKDFNSLESEKMRIVFTETIANNKSSLIKDNLVVHSDLRFLNKINTTPIEGYIYILVPHLLFIYSLEQYDKLKANTLKQQLIKKRATTIPDHIVHWFNSLEQQFLEASMKLSDSQKAKIEEMKRKLNK